MKQLVTLLACACLSLQALAQFSLSGKITDAEHGALPGAYVTMKDTYYQTITDNQGNFILTGIRKGDYELQISYIGFEMIRKLVSISKNITLDLTMKESAVVADAVIVSAIRASENTPTTYTTVGKEEITRQNLVQDLPYILGNQTSVVATSDAGTGIGYTGLRIRGSDATRINVTINGVPLNDPESHAVYWVDVPDFASSVNSLQLQRGVGSSTNGAGAFGASMNFETNAIKPEPFGVITAAAGSYGTYRTSFQAGTGLIRDHWYLEGRGSKIGSDGYIDRASSKLSSFFLQGGYTGNKTLIKALAFGGNEKTYQAWYGIDGQTMQHDRTFNWAGAVFEDDGTLWFYDNQTDNYKQDHYQLHLSHRFSGTFSLNLSGHYTYGRGYYEEYRQDEPFSDYGMHNLYFGRDSVLIIPGYRYFYHDSVTTTDLVRRRWLDNHYFGTTWSVRNRRNKTDIVLGGAWNKYDNARHYGEVIWAEYAGDGRPGDNYYNNTGFKNDFNLFLKTAWSPLRPLTIYGDVQYRRIRYQAEGVESSLEPFRIDENFNFFNPKLGLSYELKAGTLYASYGMAHREPIRDDYLDAAPGEKPEPEILGDLEVGFRKTGPKVSYALNYYLMNYHNQLVLTGEINDDGAYIRRNTGKSYRTGVELEGGYAFSSNISLDGNLSLMSAKTNYREANDQGSISEFRHVDLSFSPRVTGGLGLRISPARNLECDWRIKYVSRQFLGNTGNEALTLDSYASSDLRIGYLLSLPEFAQVEFSLVIMNLFNAIYESNGYVYDDTPYFYPQAGIHAIGGITLKF